MCLIWGAGLGFAARLLKPHATSLHGVDISPRMVEKARERNIYDDFALE